MGQWLKAFAVPAEDLGNQTIQMQRHVDTHLQNQQVLRSLGLLGQLCLHSDFQDSQNRDPVSEENKTKHQIQKTTQIQNTKPVQTGLCDYSSRIF